MKKLAFGLSVLAMVLVSLMLTVAFAETVNCVPPCPACPPVQVTCECSQVELPGIWVMNINGTDQCGKVTTIGSGILFERNDGEKTFYFANKVKRMHQVESCE